MIYTFAVRVPSVHTFIPGHKKDAISQEKYDILRDFTKIWKNYEASKRELDCFEDSLKVDVDDKDAIQEAFSDGEYCGRLLVALELMGMKENHIGHAPLLTNIAGLTEITGLPPEDIQDIDTIKSILREYGYE